MYPTFPTQTARWACIFWLVALTGLGIAQSDTRPLMSEPKPADASPFLPEMGSKVRLPVALNGFCIVTLREQQQWVAGIEGYQHLFDGQIYWFASPRERDVFGAAPRRYVPALAGDCVVTLAETGERQRGNPKYGVLHGQRLFFFASAEAKETFAAEPGRYDDVDLANEGNCLVSLTDRELKMPGLPATTVIVEGTRYQFAGWSEQQAFLNNMARYGVVRSQPIAAPPPPAKMTHSPPQPLTPQATTLALNESSVDEPEAHAVAEEAVAHTMDGYCPVSIHENGTWVEGSREYAVEFDGHTYLLAGEEQRKKFLDDPAPYIPALCGDCVVSQVAKNKRVPGTIFHASHFDGRLYLFAGIDEKQVFKASPETYVDADLAADGNCVVSLVDEGATVPGLPELLTWHHGKRYYFASLAHQNRFRENADQYQHRMEDLVQE